MIGLSGPVRVLVATKPVDFRKDAEGLAALVREQMQADPFSGAVYVFRAKRADRVKWHCFSSGDGRYDTRAGLQRSGRGSWYE